MISVKMWVKNTLTIQIDGLKDKSSGTLVTGATVTVNLVDQNGASVTGATNIPLTDVAGSPGSYSGSIASTFNPTAGQNYTLQITAVSGGVQGYWEKAIQVGPKPV